MIYDLRPVVAAIKTRDKQLARNLLKPILTHEPSADAFYLASMVTDNRQQAIQMLRRAIHYDPAHQNARQALARLQRESPTRPDQALPIRQEAAQPASGGASLRRSQSVRETSIQTPKQSPSSDKRITPPASITVNDRLSKMKGVPQLPVIPKALQMMGYTPSGKSSPLALLLALIASLLMGLFAGVALYFIGQYVIDPVVTGLKGLIGWSWQAGLAGEIRIGTRTIFSTIVMFGFMGLIGLLYPIALSTGLAFLVWQIVKFSRVRNAGQAALVGLLSAGLGYAVFMGLAIQNTGLAHTSSGIFYIMIGFGQTPWWVYVAIVVEVLLFLGASIGLVMGRVENTPFSEATQRWYDNAWQSASITWASIPTLFELITTNNVEQIRMLESAGKNAFPRLEVRQRGCAGDEQADYQLAFKVHWTNREVEKLSNGTLNEQITKEKESWFSIMIPAALGNALKTGLFAKK